MKNRVENLFLTKIRATFVLSNVGFPTLIDLTNLTREIPCREARVSSFMYGREPPRARGFPQDCGFCARAAGSAPGPRVLLRGCGFYSGAADFTPGLRIPIYITGGGACTGPCRRGKAHKPVSDRGTRPLCRGGAHKLVSDRGTRPLCRGWVGVRALFKQGARALPEGRGVQVLCRDSARCGRPRKAGAEGIRRGVQKKRAFSRGKSDIFFYFCINWENSELKCRSCMTRRM